MWRVGGPLTTESIISIFAWSFQTRPRSLFPPLTVRCPAHPIVTADSLVLADRPARRCSVNDRMRLMAGEVGLSTRAEPAVRHRRSP